MSKLPEIVSPAARLRCREVPGLEGFAALMAETAARDADAFWACAEPLAQLLASGFCSRLMAWELACLRADPDYVSSSSGELEFEVLRVGLVSFSIRLYPATSINASVKASGLLPGFCEHGMIANVGSNPLEVQRWRQGSEGSPDILDRARRLEERPTVLLHAGQPPVLFEAHRDVARCRAVGGATVVAGLTRAQVTRVRWIYDAETLSPARAEAADPSAARLPYAIALLSALGHGEAAPVIAGLTSHPDHFVRWAAVRRVMELDSTLGLELLRRAAADPHPHVQRAALRSLESLERN